MVELNTTRFWNVAVQSGLVDGPQLEGCWSRIPLDKRTADAADRRLARKAVEMGYLTLWQAQQLLGGVRPQLMKYDKYVLLDMIGQGGMGRVYLARDVRLGRRVALKVLSRERMNNPRAVARFRREAKVGAQLQHENLVRIYDEGEAHGYVYLVMEYIEGKTVGRLLADRGPISYPVAARIARQVAAGLEHLHHKGLLHRDVNPMNVLVDRDGTAKLTDLGLAIDLGEPEDIVTRDGATVGTFDYISPEQAKHSRLVDIRSDIYSLGCTLYHMLAGRVPFPQPSLPEKLYAHQVAEPDALASLVPGIPPGLETVVSRMMSKSVETRYQAPLEVVQALEPYQSGPATLSVIETAPDPARLDPASSALGSIPPTVQSSGGSNVDPRPAGAAVPELASTSDPLAAFARIDLGPEQRLSETMTSSPSVPGDEARSKLWIAAGAILVLALAVFALVRAARSPGFGAPASAAAELPKTTPKAPPDEAGPPTDIAVHWRNDNSETPQPDLHAAIQTAVGKPAEVVLRNSKELQFERVKPYEITGPVVIRAADGARPKLRVTLSGGAPFFKGNSSGSLVLSGLDIEFGAPAGARTPPVLIEISHSLVLDRCRFATLSGERNAIVAKTDGERNTVSGCVFDGFDRPLSIVVYPRSETTIRQSLFLGYHPGESPAGWAVMATGRFVPHAAATPGAAPRGLTIDHCTLVGAGLLGVKDFSAEAPAHADVRGTVVKGGSVLLWENAVAFPAGLEWSGQENHYDLAGAAWVLKGPDGVTGVPNGPADADSWIAALKNESKSIADPLQFASGQTPPSASPEPHDYALAHKDGSAPSAGIDDRYVGPGAKAVEARK